MQTVTYKLKAHHKRVNKPCLLLHTFSNPKKTVHLNDNSLENRENVSRSTEKKKNTRATLTHLEVDIDFEGGLTTRKWILSSSQNAKSTVVNSCRCY